MSQDFQIAFPCPHIIREEQVQLEADRRTLPTRQVMGGIGAVRILVNDSLEIPSKGLFSSARLKGTYIEPFSIPANEQELTITTQSGSFTITVPSGYITAQTVLDLLAPTSLISASKDTKGRLIFNESNFTGTSSVLLLKGTAVEHLGFQIQKGATGKILYPGWSLLSRPVLGSLTERGYHIVFNSEVRTNPYFKVDYQVPRTRCLRCQSTGIENDYRFDEAGEVILINNENLLYQACVKLLLTRLGSNPYHRWYGTTIIDKVGSKAIGGTANGIRFEVSRALDDFRNTQSQQAKYQFVSPKERLSSVDSINVQADPNDPTVFLVNVVVRNSSNDPIVISIVFSVPGAVALSGTNRSTFG